MNQRFLGITFAGGGNRAFYQYGFMRVRSDLWNHVGAIASCSAGACVATFILSERGDVTSDFWKQRRAHVTKNFEWGNLLKGKKLTPHAPVYRDTLLYAYREGGLERIKKQPFPIYILTAELPAALPATLATLLGMTAYSVEKMFKKGMMHPSWGKYLGFRDAAFDARECSTPEELTALVLASSATPPFTPLGDFASKKLLDGGMVDNVPAFLLDDAPIEKHLVMLTRPYPKDVLGRKGNRLYLAPSEPTPVTRWDYTRPDLVDATIEMGAREAELYKSEIDEFLKG